MQVHHVFTAVVPVKVNELVGQSSGHFFISSPPKKPKGAKISPLRPYKLMIQRVQFIEGSDSRNEVLSETSDDDGG